MSDLCENPLQRRGLVVTSITLVAMMIAGFGVPCIWGAKFLWCFMTPFITVGLYYPIFMIMMRTRGWGKNHRTVILGMPKILWLFYLYMLIKISLVVGARENFFGEEINFLDLLKVSMFINFFASIVMWFGGIRTWMKYSLE